MWTYGEDSNLITKEWGCSSMSEHLSHMVDILSSILSSIWKQTATTAKLQPSVYQTTHQCMILLNTAYSAKLPHCKGWLKGQHAVSSAYRAGSIKCLIPARRGTELPP